MSAKLQEAKAHSDAGRYAAKTFVLRELIKGAPADWVVDSHQEREVGVTHSPTGWRYHLPRRAVADLLPGADPAATAAG